MGPASLLTETEARKLARGVLLRAQTGGDPAEDHQAARLAPSFQTFLDSYWRRASPHWKASTQRTHGVYRRGYASHAAALSETLPMIGKLLGHQEIRSTARYTRLADTDVLRTAGEVDGIIAAFIGEIVPSKGPRPGAAIQSGLQPS